MRQLIETSVDSGLGVWKWGWGLIIFPSRHNLTDLRSILKGVVVVGSSVFISFPKTRLQWYGLLFRYYS